MIAFVCHAIWECFYRLHLGTMATESSADIYLADQLKACVKNQFTGQLDIQGSTNQRWCLYFFMGRIVRDRGGEHPVRRWRRQLSQHCPQLDLGDIYPSGNSGSLDYQALANLVKQQRIPREQALKVIEGSIIEVLFDIIQQEAIGRTSTSKKLSYTLTSANNQNFLHSQLLPTNIKYLWQPTQQHWQSWQAAGLTSRSPNLAPVVKAAEQLERQVPERISRGFQRLLRAMNGNRTLRDLAVKFGQSPLLLLQFLMPFIFRGLIDLVDLPDLDFETDDDHGPVTVIFPTPLPRPATPIASTPKASEVKPSGPLIAYIDDSPLYNLAMGQILTRAGYQFITILDPLQALQTLLEHKPELVFLDLVMPIANGYEICAQIRRISIFEDMPIVILTSSDGIVDRLRAKLVGSSDFLSKPIREDKVLGMLKKHLKQSKLTQTQKSQINVFVSKANT